MDLSPLLQLLLISVTIGLLCYGGVRALKHDSRQKPMRQFGIGDLMFFTFLWALCFSLVRVQPLRRTHFAWNKDWIILATWLVLAAFYVWKRHFVPLAMHCLGVAFVTIGLGLSLLGGQSRPSVDWAWMVSVQMFLGCFLGLGIFSIMKLLGMFQRDRSAK
jgi:hypothetical protein